MQLFNSEDGAGVIARPMLKGTVPFGLQIQPLWSGLKNKMCPLPDLCPFCQTFLLWLFLPTAQSRRGFTGLLYDINLIIYLNFWREKWYLREWVSVSMSHYSKPSHPGFQKSSPKNCTACGDWIMLVCSLEQTWYLDISGWYVQSKTLLICYKVYPHDALEDSTLCLIATTMGRK